MLNEPVMNRGVKRNERDELESNKLKRNNLMQNLKRKGAYENVDSIKKSRIEEEHGVIYQCLELLKTYNDKNENLKIINPQLYAQIKDILKSLDISLRKEMIGKIEDDLKMYLRNPRQSLRDKRHIRDVSTDYEYY